MTEKTDKEAFEKRWNIKLEKSFWIKLRDITATEPNLEKRYIQLGELFAEIGFKAGRKSARAEMVEVREYLYNLNADISLTFIGLKNKPDLETMEFINKRLADAIKQIDKIIGDSK